MKKGIVILTLLVFAITTTMILVPGVEAASAVIRDDPTDPIVKAKDECLVWIDAADGDLDGHYAVIDPNVWLRGPPYGTPTGSVAVVSTIACNVVYIQFHSSDNNDGIADIYVDGDLVVRIDTYNRGHWYVEIKNLPTSTHKVNVTASDNYDFTGVIVSPHHAAPDIDHTGDLDVWYFCFDSRAVGGLSIPVDKLGLLAPYIALASTIVVTAVTAAIYAKRVEHRKRKE